MLRTFALGRSVARFPRYSPKLGRFYSTEAAKGTVQELTSMKELRAFLNNGDKVSVIDFYAVWCGPCKMLEPIFAALSEKVPEVQFGRVDVDNAQDIAQEYAIAAMPTCIILKGDDKLETIVGANPTKLVDSIAQHSGIDFKSR